MMPHRLTDKGERFATLALLSVGGLRRSNLQALRSRHGSREAALGAVTGAREAALRALENLDRSDAWVLLPRDSEWPERFGRTNPPVEMLFVRGSLDLSRPTIALVGSRHATQYGINFATELGSALAADGCVIVSGGALGIDGAAHRGALEHGRTIVVFGGGLDHPYPPQHEPLFDEVLARGGTLVSEAPFGTRPLAGLFPRRNRIIAALSRGVVVVQAARGSGSLITARLARELDIPVFAVPGAPGDAVAEGTKDLLRSGAQLCLGPEEIREALGLVEPAATEALPSSSPCLTTHDPTLNRLECLMGVSPRPLDDLAREAGLSSQQTAIAMTRLELLGLANRAPGGGFFRPPRRSPRAIRRESPHISGSFRLKDAQ